MMEWKLRIAGIFVSIVISWPPGKDIALNAFRTRKAAIKSRFYTRNETRWTINDGEQRSEKSKILIDLTRSFEWLI